jgi:lysophospholipase L1-like esterase
LIVGSSAVIGLLVATRLAPEKHTARLAVAAAAGALAAPAGGFWVGVWLALAIPLAEWAVLRRPPLPRVPTSDPAGVPGVVVLTAVAAFNGRQVMNRYLPVAITLFAFALTFVAAQHPTRMRRFVETIQRWVGAVMRVLLFGLLGLLVVVAPWIVDRLAFTDPTATVGRKGSNWLPLQRTDARADRPWSHRRSTIRPPRGPRLRRTGVLVVLVGLIGAALTVGYLRRGPSAPIPAGNGAVDGSVPAAFAGTDWWPEYLEQMNWVFFDPGAAYNPLRYPEMGEVHTTYIDIVDGERRSWQPPSCDCPTVEVWLYGGSTMVGMGQRDEHTIPSELAKLAWEDGISLRVRNRGVLGDLHWEEAQRFAWDVESEEPPAFVVFYSGSNDVVGTQYRDGLGAGLDGTPVDWTAENAVNDSQGARRALERIPSLLGDDAPPWASIPPEPDVAPLGASELGAYVAKQYQRSRQVALRTADALDIGAAWFWQPARYTRPPVASEPQADAEHEAYQREAYRAAAAGLASDVHDISDVFDLIPRAIFYDDVHTNEEGAALVASAIYERIKPELLALGESTPAS